jgi:hypothetical protein
MGVRRERGRWDERERVWKEERRRGEAVVDGKTENKGSMGCSGGAFPSFLCLLSVFSKLR